MSPLAGTGAVGSSILGRRLGMFLGTTLAAIALGSAVGAGAMHFGANLIEPCVVRDIPAVQVGRVVAVGCCILVLGWCYRRWQGVRARSRPVQSWGYRDAFARPSRLLRLLQGPQGSDRGRRSGEAIADPEPPLLPQRPCT